MREGPFEVEEALGPLTYRLKLPRGWKIHPVFHASLLSPFKQTAVHGPAYAEPAPELVDGEEHWEPEAILQHKKGMRWSSALPGEIEGVSNIGELMGTRRESRSGGGTSRGL